MSDRDHANADDVREMLRRRAHDVTGRPDAWERIIARVEDGASTAPPAPRGRGRALALAAAAVVLVVALVTTIAGQWDDGDVSRVVTDGQEDPTTPTTGPTTSSTVAPRAQSFAEAAEAAARAWVRAAARRDADAMWAVLAEDSRKAVGDRDDLDVRLPDLETRFGSWPKGVSYRTVVLVGDGVDGVDELPADVPRLAVVVLTGGDPTVTASVPVRGTAAAAFVDPLVDVPIDFDFDNDEEGSGDTWILNAIAPPGSQVWFLFDGDRPARPDRVQPADLDPEHRQPGDGRHQYSPPARTVGPGLHWLTVVARAADGRVASRSIDVIV